MPNKLRDDIAECYRHADACAQRAKGEPDARLRQDFLDWERRWLLLARSHELTEQLICKARLDDPDKPPKRCASREPARLLTEYLLPVGGDI